MARDTSTAAGTTAPHQADATAPFAQRVVSWQREHGRHHLPWQGTRDPYRIWLSEIMLQQTQVSTVIDYYQRFLARFPDVASLAAAPVDDVMPYWAGLGYYARARNLHRCAQAVVSDWGGRFPTNVDDIATLPGIGPSTAAAIAAFAYGARTPIMDGNVKRVFARHFGIEGDPTRRAVEQAFWQQARDCVAQAGPELDMVAYTQGLMDLGATVCTRGKPDCPSCPVRVGCIACAENRQQSLPTPRARKAQAQRQTGMLIIVADEQVLMERRPPQGIWGGLWSLPEFDPAIDAEHASQALGVYAARAQALAAFEHVFTHFRLRVMPWQIEVKRLSWEVEADNRAWISINALAQLAMPAPVHKLLTGLFPTDPAQLPLR